MNMKRSRINEIMRAADDLIRFANWSPDQFRARTDVSTIIDARCG